MNQENFKSELKPSIKYDLLICITSLIYEGLIFAALYKETISFTLFIFLHILFVCSIIPMILFYKKKRYYLKNLLIIGLETAVLGLFGSAISAIVISISLFIAERQNRLQLFLEEISRDQFSHIEELGRRLEYTESLETYVLLTEPFEDIITYGTTREKQSALLLAMRYFKPSFIPFIMKAAQDKDNTIRVLSATIISSIRKSVMEKFINLEKQLKTNQGDLNLLIIFLDIYKNFILTNFTKYERINELAEDYITVFRAQFFKNKGDICLKLLFVQLLAYREKDEEAKLILSECVEYFERQSNLNIFYSIIYLSLLFRYSYFNQMRKFAAAYQIDNKNLSPELRNILDMWQSRLA